MTVSLGTPVPLDAAHIVDDFSCGEQSLDVWLRHRALNNHVHGASRTFVSVGADGRVYGYYALAASTLTHDEAIGAVRRNMPEPIPALLLARLAVDYRAQGQKLGAALLRDAYHRVAIVAQHTGVRALLVNALNERAKNFYMHYGFKESPVQPLTLMLPIKYIWH
ncbi:MAG: GNAT family N-acetyltransferase [Actinomycetaceae bacterium]|nr:GNAT family N-acetyltransferase [Actinomycetaceae bacterium]